MSINVNVNMKQLDLFRKKNVRKDNLKVAERRRTFSSVSKCFYNVANYLQWFNMLLSDKYCTFSVRMIVSSAYEHDVQLDVMQGIVT